MSASTTDYDWFVASIDRVGETSDTEEQLRIIGEAMRKAGLEGLGELAAAIVLIGQYCGARVILLNLRHLFADMPRLESSDYSDSWAVTTKIASAFLQSIAADLTELDLDPHQREGVRWNSALKIAESLLRVLVKGLKDLDDQLPREGMVN